VHYLPVIPWIVLGLVWAAAAPFSNKTVQRESIFSRLSYSAPLAFAAWILFSPVTQNIFPFLRDRIGAGNQAVWWIGVAVEIVGMSFVLWARFTLGKLWSGSITFKENHRLVQSGPFSITRHPIYTGIIGAALGTAMTDGSVRGFIAVFLMACGFAFKLSKEEKLMAASFGDEHRDYRARVRRLIPFVW
jgi:protein-S-isoprenylcysteine O-methyltransferase Ste14